MFLLETTYKIRFDYQISHCRTFQINFWKEKFVLWLFLFTKDTSLCFFNLFFIDLFLVSSFIKLKTWLKNWT